MPHIPFQTLAQRHLVFAYCAVWLLQFGYAGWLLQAWRQTRPRPQPLVEIRTPSEGARL